MDDRLLREEIYQCIICLKKIRSRRRFNYHVLKKHKNRLKRCDLCHVAFLDATSRTLHRNNHLTRKKNVYKCSLCPKAFFNSPRLINHEPRHGIYRPDDGIVCREYRHIQSVLLPNHTNEYIGFENLFTCGICSKSFRRIKNLERHKLRHKNTDHSCDICSLLFSNEDELNAHILSCKTDIEQKVKPPVLELIQCNVCEKSLSGVLNWKRHIGIHARKEANKKYICRYCNKRFTLPINLFRHFTKAHPDEKPYFCSDCNLPFKRKNEFSAHIETHKISEQTGKIKFDSDNRVVFESLLQINLYSNEPTSNLDSKNLEIYSNNNSNIQDLENSLKAIKKRSDSIKKSCTQTVKCHICGLKLSKNSLRYHIARHQLPKKFSCYICSVKFQSKTRLDYHIQQHFKHDQQLCICGVRSENIVDMENHLKYFCQNKHNSLKSSKDESIFQDLIRRCNIGSLDDDSVVIVDVRNESPPLNKSNQFEDFTNSNDALKRFSFPSNITIKKISFEEANKRKKIEIKGFRIDDGGTNYAAASHSPEQNLNKNPEEIMDTVLINVNPLAHLIPNDLTVQEPSVRKKGLDYENIIKRHLSEDIVEPNDIIQEKKKYYKTKEYDYAAIIERTLGEPVRQCDTYEFLKEKQSEKKCDSGIAKFDYAMLVKDSIGDGIIYD